MNRRTIATIFLHFKRAVRRVCRIQCNFFASSFLSTYSAHSKKYIRCVLPVSFLRLSIGFSELFFPPALLCTYGTRLISTTVESDVCITLNISSSPSYISLNQHVSRFPFQKNLRTTTVSRVVGTNNLELRVGVRFLCSAVLKGLEASNCGFLPRQTLTYPTFLVIVISPRDWSTFHPHVILPSAPALRNRHGTDA